MFNNYLMIHLRNLLLSLFLLCGYSSICQINSVFSFSERIYDFGKIKEIDGVQTHRFSFVNNGKLPIIIRQVEASCGCTSTKWTNHPILPNKSGYIDVDFDPSNRPGNFNKVLRVMFNMRPFIINLKITGNVKPKVRTILDEYPYEFPSGIRFKYSHIAFLKIKESTSKDLEIRFLNNSNKAISPEFVSLPSFIKLVSISKSVDSMKEGFIKLKFLSKDFKLLGFVEKELKLLVNKETEKIRVTAQICEDFSKLSEAERHAAPRISVKNKVYKFGKVLRGEYISREFVISNKGETNLIIRRVYSNNMINYELPVYELSPNDSTKLNITLGTVDLKGNQNIVVKIISNDPSRQEIKLRFIGGIKD